MRRKTAGILNGAIPQEVTGKTRFLCTAVLRRGIWVNSVIFTDMPLHYYMEYGSNFLKNIIQNQFKTIPATTAARFIFSLSSLTLFEAFKHIEVGIACTILFIYPVLVSIIMIIFFKKIH